MSMKRIAMRITLPGLVNDFLHELMTEIGLNKSDLLEAMVFFVSMPENMKAFKNQYVLGDAGEDEDDDEDEEEEEDVEGPDVIGELLGGLDDVVEDDEDEEEEE